MRQKQMGFTLVEIAIVLVIIGLLLGGVLKGQELVNSAKVKNIANDFRSIATFVYAYQDKYRVTAGRRSPGGGRCRHDGNGECHSLTANPSPCAGDARINGAWNSAAATGELPLLAACSHGQPG